MAFANDDFENARRVKYWEIIADRLSKAGWSWGWVSVIDFEGRTSGLLTRIAATASASLSIPTRYSARLLNLNVRNAALIGGLIYKPYYVLSILTAGIVVWFGTQTWDWSQQMTWPKTATCFALGWVALIVLATQEYNPFIYFIF